MKKNSARNLAHIKYLTSRKFKSLNRLSIRFINDNELGDALIDYIIKTKTEKLGEEFLYFLKQKNVKRKINAYAEKIEEIGVNSDYFDHDLAKLLKISSLHLITEKDKINGYLKLRNKFELCLENDNYTDAIIILEQAKEKYGESLWYIKSKLLALYLKGKSEDMQSFCDETKSRLRDGFISSLVNYYIMTTQSNEPKSSIDIVIQRSLRELNAAGFVDVSSFLRELIIPDIFRNDEINIKSLNIIQQLPIIDQYNFLINSIPSFYSDNLVNTQEMELCENFLKSLVKVIDDERLERSCILFSKEDKITKNDIIDKVNHLFNNGDYLSVIEILEKNTDQIGSSLNILAKCYSYTNIQTKLKKGVYTKAIKNLVDIYSLSPNISQAYEELSSQIIRFHGTKISLNFQLALLLGLPNFHPSIKILLIYKKCFINLGNTLPATSYWAANLLEDISSCCNITSLDEMVSIKNFGEKPLLKDCIENIVKIQLEEGDIEKIILLASDSMINTSESYFCFPLHKIMTNIENDFICSLDSLISCHFYKKFISNDKSTLLNEIFEEYMVINNIKKPSELLKTPELCTNEKTIFFIKEICSLENMDFLAEFQNSDELRAERLTLLEHLHKNEAISREEYSSESETIVNQVVLDSAASNFQASKIYVDELSIRKKHSKEMSTLFELYKYADESKEEESVIIFKETSDSLEQALMSGGKSDILIRMIRIILYAFLFDENHGLDTNLSTEIRHGFFSNYLRSDVEARKLVTETDDNGEYKNNDFWREIYTPLISDNLLFIIDEQLRSFSKEFNSLIHEAQIWMKVSYITIDNDEIFKYGFDIDNYNHIKSVIDNASSPEIVTNEIFKILWDQTEYILNKIRDRLNVDLKEKMDTLFDDFLTNLNNAKRNAVLTDLISSINQSRNKTREIISDIAEWFRVSHTKEFSNQTIPQIIDVSVNCLEKIRGNVINIEKEISHEMLAFTINGVMVKKLILSLIMIFENSVRHSGLDTNVEIKTVCSSTLNGFKIDISNNLSDLVHAEIDNDKIDEINKKLSSPDSIELMREEGGTGLVKAFQYLKSIGTKFDLSVSINGKNFVASIENEKQHIIH